ncbi:HepT-like ribonuclease domain-containing protein [Chlorobium sp. N1]|uniref:HepT-like ribonuclease domain-containing protein n=1 Tax=Chlorobium sp. N1 TaxID=2491138 RepID=UPI001A951783|nr:HepT-like ribonuclease domain-containing protein [Chlorobium sp. N1]
MTSVCSKKNFFKSMMRWRESIEGVGDINSVDDFLDSDHGIDMLDAIAMMLIAIGENFKKIDKETEGKLLSNYPTINWAGVKGIRDILSHQYFDIDAEAIFHVCTIDLPALRLAVTSMIETTRSE